MNVGDKVTWSRFGSEFAVVDMVVSDPEIVQIESENGTPWYADMDELTVIPSDVPAVKEKAFETLVKAYEMYLGHEPDRKFVVSMMDMEVDERGHLG
jgi:hypothetical protein